MNISLHDYRKLINVPLAIAIASVVVIVFTTTSLNANGLSALIGGQVGLLLSLLFLVVIHITFTNAINIDMLPLFLLMCVISMLLYYIITNFDHISSQHVPAYYTAFSWLFNLFVGAQLWLVFGAMCNTNKDFVASRLFTRVTLCVLGLLNLLTWVIVITLGIVLQYYTTQG